MAIRSEAFPPEPLSPVPSEEGVRKIMDLHRERTGKDITREEARGLGSDGIRTGGRDGLETGHEITGEFGTVEESPLSKHPVMSPQCAVPHLIAIGGKHRAKTHLQGLLAAVRIVVFGETAVAGDPRRGDPLAKVVNVRLGLKMFQENEKVVRPYRESMICNFRRIARIILFVGGRFLSLQLVRRTTVRHSLSQTRLALGNLITSQTTNHCSHTINPSDQTRISPTRTNVCHVAARSLAQPCRGYSPR